VVDVSGNAAVCDCQPENRIGNILKQPFSEIWNGNMMIDYRRRMPGPNPPEACMICPRF
jgi:radical SAM protein with 4Fe4S-binding SPASM domain